MRCLQQCVIMVLWEGMCSSTYPPLIAAAVLSPRRPPGSMGGRTEKRNSGAGGTHAQRIFDPAFKSRAIARSVGAGHDAERCKGADAREVWRGRSRRPRITTTHTNSTGREAREGCDAGAPRSGAIAANGSTRGAAKLARGGNINDQAGCDGALRRSRSGLIAFPGAPSLRRETD